MTTSKRLAAHRKAARTDAACPPDDTEHEDLTPDEPGKDDGATPTTTSTKKEKSMDDEAKAAIEAARMEGQETGRKSANERMNAVFASEHYAGREAAAAKLLGKPNLSAEDITELLADMPKAEASKDAALTEEQQRAAAEEGGRKEMKAALDENKNSDIDAGGGAPQPDKRAAADAVWDKAYGLKGAR